MPSLNIFLLGNLRVLWGENPLPPFPTQKTRTLFAYLVTHRQRAHPRAHLAGTFWADFPETRAQRNLNTTLWRLRRILPDDYVLVEEDALAFNQDMPYWLDVAAFETGCSTPATSPVERTHALEEAVRLYRGDFLEGCYEEWALIEAERLRTLYAQALSDLLECYRTSGALIQALECGKHILRMDPLREDVHRRVMELYAQLGQREAALAQFATCQRALQDELGIAPSAETLALSEQIRTWTVPRPPSAIPAAVAPLAETALPAILPRTPFDQFGQAPLVGREAELSLLRARLEALRSAAKQTQVAPEARPRVGMILVEGEAGVGKTRLTQETRRVADALGVSVLCGICSDLQAPPPYQGLVEALRAGIPLLQREDSLPLSPIWLSELIPLLPELAQAFAHLPARLPASSVEAQGRLLEAIAQYLQGLGRRGPHLLILEDLHWADSSSLEALRYVLPRLRTVPLLLMVTLRPEEISKRAEIGLALTALNATGWVEHIALSRLSAAETEKLVYQTLGLAEERPALAQFIYRETEGNPFFVGQVLKTMVEEGQLRLGPGGGWESVAETSLPLPQGIRQAVERRLARLTPASQDILEMAAVLGHDFEFDLLQQAVSQREEITLEASDDLLRLQLLMEEDRLYFSHDKIRQVVYQGLSRARRRYLHRRAGIAVAQFAPERVEEIANHFYLAKDYRRALPYCLQAGERARLLYANQSALTYYDWAIEATRQVKGSEGAQALVTAHEQRGRVWEHLGNYARALADYATMQEMAQAIGDRATFARAVRRAAWVQGEQLGEWEKGLAGARRAWELAKEAGSPREQSIALLDMGYFHAMRGEYAQSLDALRAALAIAHSQGDEGAKAASLEYMASTLQFQGKYAQALEASQEGARIWEKRGNRRAEAFTLLDMGHLHLGMGNLKVAEEMFKRAEAILREIEAHFGVPWALLAQSVLQRTRSQCQASLETLAQITDLEQTGEKRNAYLLALIRFHRGMAHWNLGHLGAALTDLDESLTWARQSKTPTLVVEVLNDSGRCFRQIEEIQRALTLHREALSHARQVTFRAGEIRALSELGLDRVLSGLTREGLADLQAAQQQSGDWMRWQGAEILLNLAEGYAAAGQPTQALDPARQAVAATDAMGVKELGAWGHLVLGRVWLALDRRGAAEGVLREGLGLVDPTGQSLTRAWLLVALSRASRRRARKADDAALREAREIILRAAHSLGDEKQQTTLLDWLRRL